MSELDKTINGILAYKSPKSDKSSLITTHKAIREALEAATKNGWQTHVVDNDRLRALLADLDAKTEALKSIQAAIYMDDAGQLRLTRSFDESVIDTALKGTP